MFNTLEELLSGTGQGPYTPPDTPSAGYRITNTNQLKKTPYEFDSNHNEYDDYNNANAYFQGISRDPSGNYGEFDPAAVRAWQRLYKSKTGKDIKVDGYSGKQTFLAALKDQMSNWVGNGDKGITAPAFTPTEASPLSFDEYTGRNPLNDLLEQFKPKKEISEERMNKAAGFAALGALLRNVVDANYGSQGAQIVQHTDPEWAMKLSKRYEQLKDQRKADELRYNMLRLQDGMRGRDRYDSYRDRIDERNMNNRDFATRQKFEDENKQYWYDRQRADHLSDYNRNKADQYTMIDKQTAKQKELARFNSNLQEGAFERRLKKMRELGVTSTGKPANGSGGYGGGKPFMTYYDAASRQNLPLTDGQAMEVVNWAFNNKLITDSDLSAMRQSMNGVGSKNEVIRLVQKAMPAYMKAVSTTPQRQTTSTGTPSLLERRPVSGGSTPRKTSGAPTSIAVPKSVSAMLQGGLSMDEAQREYDELSAQGYSDDDIYNVIAQ